MTTKNQIKSYTAAATKKEMTNFFVFMGGVSNTNTTVDDTDISIISRITQDEVSIVIPRVNWSYNKQFEPYYFNSSGENTYCYNNATDLVYLCVGKNQPTGLLGETQFLSTQEPSHYTGIQAYSDGYVWMALYKIDFSLSKFLTESTLPVNNLYEFTTQTTSGSYSSKYNSICSGGAGISGSCFFYYNEDTIDPLTATIHSKGDLVSGIGSSDWLCSYCHSVGDSLGYKSVHINYLSASSVIVQNPIDELTTKFYSGDLDTNNKYFIQYNNYIYAQNLNKGIVYLHLDVSSLSIEDRVLATPTAEITILDPLGIGALANITTYYDIRRNAFIANGVTLRASGSNYVNPSFNIPAAVNTNLRNALKTVLMPDIADPSTFLPAPKVLVIKQITKSTLDTIGTNQTSFSKVGILKNITTTDSVNPLPNTQPNQAINGRMTTKIRVLPVYGGGGSISIPSPAIDPGKVYVDTKTPTVVISTDETTATSSDYESNIVAIATQYDETGVLVGTDLEIAGVDELLFHELTNATYISINNTNFEVDINGISTPDYTLNTIDYVTTKVLSNNIVFDTSTGSEPSTKISFLL
jgi:hypothetical protein